MPGWPRTVLTIPDARRNRSLPWSAFPDSLLADVEAYLSPLSDKKVFSFSRRGPKLKASTIAGKRVMLRLFVTCLVESGRDPASLRTLADVVSLDAAEAGLTVLHARAGGRDTRHAYNIAYMLYGIAKHWLKLDEAIVQRVQDGVQGDPPQDGRHDG